MFLLLSFLSNSLLLLKTINVYIIGNIKISSIKWKMKAIAHTYYQSILHVSIYY